MSDAELPDIFVLNPHVSGLHIGFDKPEVRTPEIDELEARVLAWADDWLRNNGARYGLEHWGVSHRVYARFVQALIELGKTEGFTVTCWD